MRYHKFLLKEDEISQALKIEEPKIGRNYPSEKVKRYMEMIDNALEAMKSKEENETNDAIVQDLRDKKKKWSNVKKETKPVKTQTEVPPEGAEQPNLNPQLPNNRKTESKRIRNIF